MFVELKLNLKPRRLNRQVQYQVRIG